MNASVEKIYDEIEEHKQECLKELPKKFVSWLQIVSIGVSVLLACGGMTLSIKSDISDSNSSIKDNSGSIRIIETKMENEKTRVGNLEKALQDQVKLLQDIKEAVIILRNRSK